MNCEATVCLPDLRLAMLLRLFFVMTDYYKLCNAHVPSLLLVKFLFVACYDSKGLMALGACYTLLSSLGSHNFTETAACTSSCCCLSLPAQAAVLEPYRIMCNILPNAVQNHHCQCCCCLHMNYCSGYKLMMDPSNNCLELTLGKM